MKEFEFDFRTIPTMLFDMHQQTLHESEVLYGRVNGVHIIMIPVRRK